MKGSPSRVPATSTCTALEAILSSPLAKLDPRTDPNAIIRVGGRLNFSDFPGQCIDAAILPTTGHVTDLIVMYFHHKGKHQGSGNTTNEIRASGYWIVGATYTVSWIIYHCVLWRKLDGTLQEQRMAELSCDWLEPALPFTNSAVNCFGPFIIKEGHKDLKHCQVLFTCEVLGLNSYCRAFRITTSVSCGS